MAIELTRLLLGLVIALFHRPLAARVMEKERVLDGHFRRRGINLPAPLSDTSAANLYFAFGIFICLLELIKIYSSPIF